MGGSLAVEIAHRKMIKRVLGVAVIDVVEGFYTHLRFEIFI